MFSLSSCGNEIVCERKREWRANANRSGILKCFDISRGLSESEVEWVCCGCCVENWLHKFPHLDI